MKPKKRLCPVCKGKKEWTAAGCKYPCLDCNETGYIYPFGVWERHLPSEDEILGILLNRSTSKAAKAISERLGNE